jgi:hypothetical protein
MEARASWLRRAKRDDVLHRVNSDDWEGLLETFKADAA